MLAPQRGSSEQYRAGAQSECLTAKGSSVGVEIRNGMMGHGVQVVHHGH